ncbi:MAG: D-alanine--D-alanine ligase [Candidatus Binatia bacterium]
MPAANRALYRKLRVGVLFGGLSKEKEISVKTGTAVIKALRQKGYRVIPIPVRQDLPLLLRKRRVAVVFNALHGKFGEDGCIQGLLEIMRIPYTGSGVTASALGMDKVFAKEVFATRGIPTPPYEVIPCEGPRKVRLALPVVVKPRAEGSTLGVTIVRRSSGLPRALAHALSFDSSCLVEKYIPGREVAVGVLNGRALGALEIRPIKGFYDYKTKYTPGLARHLYPAPLESPLYEKTLRMAEQACAALGCEGAPRVDFRVTPKGRPYVLEVNTLPGLTALSLLPEIARGEGISFPDLVENILDHARLKTKLEHGLG